MPWEAIRSVSLTEVGGVPYVGVWAADGASRRELGTVAAEARFERIAAGA